jgi:hypothetical protein
LLLEFGINASMGQTTSLAIGAWAVRPLRALPTRMLAPPQRVGQGLYYFTVSLRRTMDAPQLA